jgi:hypothetical protein
MKLTDNQGENINNIMCGAYTYPLARANESGELEMVEARGPSVSFSPQEADIYVPGAPEGCPLTIQTIKRAIGNVAVCLSCPLVYTNLPQERFDQSVR